MKMNHRYPHAIVNVVGISESAHEELLAIPGIRHSKWNESYIVPHHALEQANVVFNKYQSLVSADWEIEPKDKKEWLHYEEILSWSELNEWVLNGFLTEYQRSAIEHCGHMRGCHFWHPTGAGKTLSAILWSLLTDDNVLVVTRAASRLQYGREFEKFTSLRPHVIRPKTKKSQTSLEDYLMQEGDRKVVVVAWESLASNLEVLEGYAMEGCTVIFDESHRGKSSKRWERISTGLNQSDYATNLRLAKRRAKELGGFVPKDDSGDYDVSSIMIPAVNMTTAASKIAKSANRVVCTTATPIKDRVRDLWAQLDLAEPYSWGSMTIWAQRYCDARQNRWGGWDTTGMSNMDELRARLLYSSHSIDYRDTHRQLPAKRRQSFYIAPEDQCRATGGFAKELKHVKTHNPNGILELRLAESASRKRRAVLELIADHLSSNHKVVLFTGRRRDVDKLAEDIQKNQRVKKLGSKIWSAHGGSTATQRQEIVDEYMAHDGKNGCLLIGTGDSFGESLNMQDTDAALFVMLPYTPGQIRQWEGRFCRLGQKRPVTIYYCICEDSVDEHVADILISKMDAVEEVIGDVELAESRYAIGGFENEEEILTLLMEKLENE